MFMAARSQGFKHQLLFLPSPQQCPFQSLNQLEEVFQVRYCSLYISSEHGRTATITNHSFLKVVFGLLTMAF